MDIEKIRQDFPILKRKINEHPLVYFDNAATSQKPKQVIDAVSDYYRNHNANVHRGVHTLSDEATQLYEGAREKIAGFLGAASPRELIFTKGTTDSLNALAQMLKEQLKKDDEIITTLSEHHSNFLPWQQIANEKGAKIKILEISEKGDFPMEGLKQKLSEKTKIIAIVHASNVLGTVFPVTGISDIAHKYNPEIKVVVDGAQSTPHIPINLQKLGCDFFTFSAHKMLGPMGIGGLWIKEELLESLNPFAFGGGMISKVTTEKSTWAKAPHKFEAGTPDVAGAVGLAAAVEYLENIGMENILEHTQRLTKYALERLQEISDLKILGPESANKRTGLVSFSIKNIHPHDISGILDAKGVAVRSGQHCTAPLHAGLNLPATTRISFQIYNTKDEIDYFIEALKEGLKLLR